MDTIKVKVLDYYNRPNYYKYMPGEIFDKLEQAFLNDKVETELPKELFIKMIESKKIENWKYN